MLYKDIDSLYKKIKSRKASGIKILFVELLEESGYATLEASDIDWGYQLDLSQSMQHIWIDIINYVSETIGLREVTKAELLEKLEELMKSEYETDKEKLNEIKKQYEKDLKCDFNLKPLIKCVMDMRKYIGE